MINVGVTKIKGRLLHSTNQSSDQEWLRKATDSMEILAINGVTFKGFLWPIVLSKSQIQCTTLLDHRLLQELLIIYVLIRSYESLRDWSENNQSNNMYHVPFLVRFLFQCFLT